MEKRDKQERENGGENDQRQLQAQLPRKLSQPISPALLSNDVITRSSVVLHPAAGWRQQHTAEAGEVG